MAPCAAFAAGGSQPSGAIGGTIEVASSVRSLALVPTGNCTEIPWSTTSAVELFCASNTNEATTGSPPCDAELACKGNGVVVRS
jgi:hypothetical protein